jgi:lipopolysaccharide/colanic/teichoic acid biosynthesis glycosyltransferase
MADVERLLGADDEVVLDVGDAQAPVIDLHAVRAEAAQTIRLPDTGLLGAPRWATACKRAVDLVGSYILLVLFFPMLLLSAVLVKATSRGPIFYVQERVGKDGRPFKMLKLRSMVAGADRHRGQLQHLNVHNDGPIFKIPSDPRVTPIGRALRRLSVDELPQFVNVLLGHMSLVGPRPPLPEEYRTYGPRERTRLLVKPGITCIWQVAGRSDVDFGTWVDLDLAYIEGWSLPMDVGLLLRTLPAIVTGRGAY